LASQFPYRYHLNNSEQHIMKLTTTATTLLLLSLHDLSSGARPVRGSAKNLDDTISPARVLSGKGGKGGKGGGKCKDLETMCTMWQVFANTVRYNHVGPDRFAWWDACDEFEPFDEYLCPSESGVATICQDKCPDLNPAVNYTYCQPLLEELPEGQFKKDCIAHCVNYISKARGDCCEFQCEK